MTDDLLRMLPCRGRSSLAVHARASAMNPNINNDLATNSASSFLDITIELSLISSLHSHRAAQCYRIASWPPAAVCSAPWPIILKTARSALFGGRFLHIIHESHPFDLLALLFFSLLRIIALLHPLVAVLQSSRVLAFCLMYKLLLVQPTLDESRTSGQQYWVRQPDRIRVPWYDKISGYQERGIADQ